MKRIKITPLLFLTPVSIVLYVLYIRSGVWTPFSLIFIIGFILIVSVALLIDRVIVNQLKLKVIWGIEIVLIILAVIFFFSKCVS